MDTEECEPKPRAPALPPVLPGLKMSAERPLWNYAHLTVAFVVAFLLQIPTAIGTTVGVGKGNSISVLWGLILLRVIAAGVRKERGKGWVFYTILLYVLVPLTHVVFAICGVRH